MLESELRIEVLNAYTSLTEATSNLCAAVKNESSLVAWVQDSDLCVLSHKPISAREKTCLVISQLQYTDLQAPREILVCAGFVGASPYTIKLAIVVNERKDRFKKSILALKAAKIPIHDPYLTENMDSILLRESSTSHTLKKMGLSRLHLKQCYRKIPILNGIPQKINWTWAHTRSIKKITIPQAQDMLLKKGSDPGIQMQIQKLNSLSTQEPLAIVQELAPHLRANVVLKEENILRRIMIKGPIPIFFPCEPHMPFPDFSPPGKKCGKDKNRSQRSDVRLEPVPFLPAIRAHRYTF